MGKGRRPTPTILRLVKGNPGRRPINKKEVNPKHLVPRCPSHLSESGKAAWKRLSALLNRIGILTEADGFALERLCDCYSDILDCRALINDGGRTYKIMDAQGNTLIKTNPAVAQLRAADAQLKSYMLEFGLTPASRPKVPARPDDDKKEDPFDEYFK